MNVNTQTGEMVLGFFSMGFNVFPDNTFTAGSGFRRRCNQNTNAFISIFVADKIGATLGVPVAITGTYGGAYPYMAIGASFNPA